MRTDVTLTRREQTQLEGPWQIWGDLDKPMYDADGFMIPSDEMRGYGVTPAHTRIYGPYLPIERIDARGRYIPANAQTNRISGFAELLDEVPGLDSPEHLVTLDGDYTTQGRTFRYRCICGHRRDLGGRPPHDHQLGEGLLDLLGLHLEEPVRQMLPEVLARAAALRSPARWKWFTPRPVTITTT